MDAVGVQQLPAWDSGDYIVEMVVEMVVETAARMTAYGG
jgi:hypothetical protein